MASIHLKTFGGLQPRVPAHLLAPSQATGALHCDLRGGELVPFDGTTQVQALGGAGRSTVFPYLDEWLEWDADVDVVESPIPEDPYERIYYTGDGSPRVRGVDTLAALDVDVIVWQNGTTVRYTFASTPDLSSVIKDK